MVLKELIFDTFYFGKVWWSWKNWFLIFPTSEGCCGLEQTDFWKNSFYFGKVWWWSLKELIFNSFYVGRVLMVLKEMIFNSFYFGRMWWSWKNWFWHFLLWEGMVVLKELFLMFSTSEGCCGLERTDFWHFLLWEGMVVLKELIFNVFYFRRVLWSWKNWFLTLSMLGGMVVNWFLIVSLKEMIFNSFYFGRMWWSWKNWFLTLSTLGGYGGLERTDF